MLAYGSDRVRLAGGRTILHARLPKGWTARVEKQGTHAEFPGTAVLWNDEYYEVIEAEALPQGGVRYVLAPWREDHVIRTFQTYSAESEAALQSDHTTAQRQRQHGAAARLFGVVLGHLPRHVQQRIGDGLGVSPQSMTLISLLPSVLLLGAYVLGIAGSYVDGGQSPYSGWLGLVAYLWFGESLLRFFVVMTQGRPMGSLVGTLLYAITHPRDLAPKGESLRAVAIERTPDIELQDQLTMRGPLFSLLSVAEQNALAARYGYSYREHAYPIAWILLVCAFLGALAGLSTLTTGFRFSALLSTVVGAVITAEQVVRLLALRRGPAGSLLAFAVRPFARSLLSRA
jgi:hypothetical protein